MERKSIGHIPLQVQVILCPYFSYSGAKGVEGPQLSGALQVTAEEFSAPKCRTKYTFGYWVHIFHLEKGMCSGNRQKSVLLLTKMRYWWHKFQGSESTSFGTTRAKKIDSESFSVSYQLLGHCQNLCIPLRHTPVHQDLTRDIPFIDLWSPFCSIKLLLTNNWMTVSQN